VPLSAPAGTVLDVRKRKSVWLWVLLIVLVVLLLGLIFGGYRKGAKLGEPLEPTATSWTRTQTDYERPARSE